MAVDSLLVAAIDFGTTFSGYAFSFRHEYDRDPLKVSSNSWTGGQLMSLKTSTCVLFKPDGTFHSFGFEAEDKYSDLSDDNEHHDWYYFRRFKMKLYDNKNLLRTFQIQDDKGKKMSALKVISCAIQYLKDHMMDTCKNQIIGIVESDIQWVLTVPAIWSDAAKQFMREAAEAAGIAKERLVLCLEPEAASLYCRQIPLEKREEGNYQSFSKGTKYMVVDAGGVLSTLLQYLHGHHLKLVGLNRFATNFVLSDFAICSFESSKYDTLRHHSKQIRQNTLKKQKKTAGDGHRKPSTKIELKRNVFYSKKERKQVSTKERELPATRV